MRELVAACVEVKIEPLFCALTAAATDVLRKEGFEAKTLQTLLLVKPKLDERRLLVLDEAGAVGIDDMKRLFDLARVAGKHHAGVTRQIKQALHVIHRARQLFIRKVHGQQAEFFRVAELPFKIV